MKNKTLPISGISYGDQLTFHGIAQRKASGFKTYVAPDYSQVVTDIRKLIPFRSVVTIYDKTVPNVQRFVDLLNALVGQQLIRIPVESGEQLKTLDQVTQFTKRLNDEYDIAEQSIMFVIGGGTVCNFAGYIAATWQGMEPVMIPTNFTAIGDVAIGSLHMINVGAHKNRLQLYYDPFAVVLDPAFMNTLPKFERRSGLAETVKHGIAQDVKLFAALEEHIKAGTVFNDDALFDFALRTALLKNELMGTDPFGERTQSIFLYGHVLAHAIEPATNFQIPHGEAVAIGLLGELAFFHKPSSPIYMRTKAMLDGLGLPTQLPKPLSVSAVMKHLEHALTDKGLLGIACVCELGSLHEESGTVKRFFTPDAVRAALSAVAS